MSNIKIDYIIPAYYSDDMLKHSLEALCKQTRRDALNIIVVNDCSPNTKSGYKDVIDEYTDKLNITLIKTPHNSGPGLTKQLGIDAGTSDYYLIQDDDDLIASDDVIESYIKVIEEHYEETDIISITGDMALCNNDYSIYDKHRDGLEHGRLFYRKPIQKYNIKYVEELSLWFDDHCISSLMELVINKSGYKNIQLDKICYLYRTNLGNSTTNRLNTALHLFKYIAIDMELLKFNDITYGINNDKRIYNCISYKLFDIMLILINIHKCYNLVHEREWNILVKYRSYLMNIIKTDSHSYMDSERLFYSYKYYILGHEDFKDYRYFKLKLDMNTIEDLYYTYLSNEKTIFNCNYSELNEMIKGE